MNENKPKPISDQQIDVFLLFKSLGRFIDKVGYGFFRVFKLLKRNFIWAILLILLGLGLGFYKYKKDSSNFKHTVIVVPNFNSITYLYDAVDQVTNKIDSKELKNITKIEVEPVVDVYQFVSDDDKNLAIARYMSENTIDIYKYKKNNDTEKLYKYHKITYYTDVIDADSKIYENLINHLNNEKYYKERQKIEILDTQKKLAEYEMSVASINGIFNKLGSTNVEKETSGSMNVEMFSEMDKLLTNKKTLLVEINKIKISIIEQSKVIYDATKKLNVKIPSSKTPIFVLPILFIFLFVLFVWIKKQYVRYSNWS